jgi:tetratricopeptide (TPR) repeat protein
MQARVASPAVMKASSVMVMVLACFFAASPRLPAQPAGGGRGSGAGQSQPAHAQNPPAAQPPKPANEQNNQNPFPEDISNIPVIPSQNTPSAIYGEGGDAGRISMPASESDPVLSPEDAAAAAEGGEQSSSSSTAGMRDLLSPVNDEKQSRRRHDRNEDEPKFHETAANDESVGKYYLDNQNWKAALSRFESAMVLDPENPDVYWGLAESERNLGQFAEARANYLKVMEYDPGGHLSKEAKKALKNPEIANAKAQTVQSSTTRQ